MKKFWSVLYAIGAAMALAAFAVLAYTHCSQYMVYQESLHTWMSQPFLREQLYVNQGNAAHPAWLCFLQFCHSPVASALIIAFVATGVLAALVALARLMGIKHAPLAIVALALFAGEVFTLKSLCHPEKEQYYQLSNLVAAEKWDEIIGMRDELDLNDPSTQNILHLAYAETGMLGDRLFFQPIAGLNSLLPAEPSPDAFMLMSDIYWSMGHVALAQSYAFQANVAYGNFSPRLLKRLVDTNIVKGETQVARKYIKILKSMRNYKAWSQERETLLGNDKAILAHPKLGALRRCAITEDRFNASMGLDADLKDILRANPSHKPAMQYLGALYLINKDMPKMADAIGEFYGTDALGLTLPLHFQEAIAIATFASGQRLDQDYMVPEAIMQRCQSFWANHVPQPNTCWEYMRRTK